MPETEPPRPPTPAGSPAAPKPKPDADNAAGAPTRRQRRSGIRGLFQHLRAVGRDATSVVLGKLLEPPPEPDAPAHAQNLPVETNEKASWRVNMLHGAAERLRGAADSYIAAKLDEIEARVDAKLDHLEDRLDIKLVELHRQLREMRDRELRHRLRLLKITLIFTVLVAALSLVYKWVAKYWIS